MSGTLKTAVALALLFAVIFGVALISSSTPPPKPVTPNGDPDVESIPPLVADFTVYKFDPKAGDRDYHHHLFGGFFEIGTGGEQGTARNWVPFVVRNHRPDAVNVSAAAPSCTKCTSARGALLPAGVVDTFAAEAMTANLLMLSGVPNPLAAIAWAQIYSKLNWTKLEFNNPKSVLAIPAAASKTTPQYAIIELDFKISHPGAPADVTGNFELTDTKGAKLQTAPMKLVVNYASREAYELWPPNITAGEFPEGVTPRSFDVFVYSMTRDKFPAPKTLVPDNDGTFVLGEPAPLSAEECAKLAARLSHEMKGGVRVPSGWRVPVTIRRSVPGGPPVEVGEFEREVHFAEPGLSPVTYRTIIKGTMTGAVKIDGATKLELGDYQSQYGVKKEFTLVSDQLDLQLQLVPERCGPKYVQMKLSSPRSENGRRAWTLTLEIPAASGNKPPFTGAAVLKTFGAESTVYKFPVSGHGR